MTEDLFYIPVETGIEVTKPNGSITYGLLKHHEPLLVEPRYNARGIQQRRGKQWLWVSRSEMPFSLYYNGWKGSFSEGTIIATRAKGDARPFRKAS